MLLALAACAAHGTSGGDDSPRSSRQTLTADELQGAPWSSLYDAVSALRGIWLRKRGPISLNGDADIVVYLDGNRLGGPASLRTVPASSVQVARFLTPPEAQSQFGMNHSHGAIVVVTRP